MALGLGHGVFGDAQKDTLDIYQFEHIIYILYTIIYYSTFYILLFSAFIIYKKKLSVNDYQRPLLGLAKWTPNLTREPEAPAIFPHILL